MPTVEELKTELKERGIEIPNNAKKADLEELLKPSEISDEVKDDEQEGIKKEPAIDDETQPEIPEDASEDEEPQEPEEPTITLTGIGVMTRNVRCNHTDYKKGEEVRLDKETEMLFRKEGYIE